MWLWSATLIAYPETLIGSSTPSMGTPLIKTTTMSKPLPVDVVPADAVHPATDVPYVVEPPPYDRVQIIFTDHRLHAGETWLYDAGASPVQPRQDYPDDHNDPWGADELISTHCPAHLG